MALTPEQKQVLHQYLFDGARGFRPGPCPDPTLVEAGYLEETVKPGEPTPGLQPGTQFGYKITEKGKKAILEDRG